MDFSPPPGLDLNESKQNELYAAYITTFALAILSVALRILCRIRLSPAGLWWDDWIILLGVAMATGNFITMIIWITRGLGTHIYKWGFQGLTDFLLNLFVIEILYTLSIVLTKFSILFFYIRIFGWKNLRIAVSVIGGVVILWGLGVILTTIFQCLPVNAFWDKTIQPASCNVDVPHFFIGNAIPNILTDWALLVLPLPFVWRLQQAKSQKVALCGIFLLGGFICVISVVRLAIMLEAYKVPSIDSTWVFIGPSTWTAVEVNIGIVSANLPSLRPLLTAVLKNRLMTTRASDKLDNSGGSSEPWGYHSRNGYVMTSGTGKDRNGGDTDIRVNTTIDIREEHR